MRRKAISDAYLPVPAGKIQENRSGFLGRFKGLWGKIEIPSGSFSFYHFSFGEAKEKVGRQSQDCRRASALCLLAAHLPAAVLAAEPVQSGSGEAQRTFRGSIPGR